MNHGIHFISGLPRSGSTLLAAILRQNPRFHAGMSSPVASMYMSLQATMSARNEFHVFITDEQRRAVLRGVFENYYAEISASKVVFDTSRAWCGRLSGLVQLFPASKVLCCVRNLAEIISSIERLVQRNAFQPSRIFNFDSRGSVFGRAKKLMDAGGLVRSAHDALLEAYHGDNSHALMLIQYDSLARSPAAVMQVIYDFLGEERFEHDFDNVEYNADEYDLQAGTPGLHKVARKVQYIQQKSILPPEIEGQYKYTFWSDPKKNLRNVRIV